MLDFTEKLEEYIECHIDAEPDNLKELYRYTHLHHLYPRMCSGHYQGRLLKMLTCMINPQRVLELGTYTGYSALSIAEGMNESAHLDTIELDEEKEAELHKRFENSPYAGRIHLHIGDALEVISRLPGPWDMVFIDANKRNYLEYLETVYAKIPLGGYVLADNTLWDMKVIENEQDMDGQTKAIAEFNDVMAHDKRFEKVILLVRDGLTIMRRVI